jgi:hypothetical protein
LLLCTLCVLPPAALLRASSPLTAACSQGRNELLLPGLQEEQAVQQNL